MIGRPAAAMYLLAAAAVAGSFAYEPLLVALGQRGARARTEDCPRKDCRQAFHDAWRNLSRRWCAPRCGHELSQRASRKRRGDSWW